jgi:hypothetical protein
MLHLQSFLFCILLAAPFGRQEAFDTIRKYTLLYDAGGSTSIVFFPDGHFVETDGGHLGSRTIEGKYTMDSVWIVLSRDSITSSNVGETYPTNPWLLVSDTLHKEDSLTLFRVNEGFRERYYLRSIHAMDSSLVASYSWEYFETVDIVVTDSSRISKQKKMQRPHGDWNNYTNGKLRSVRHFKHGILQR